MRGLSTRFFLIGLSLAFLAGSLCPPSALGQATFTAQLQGTVQDATGAAVPGATVTITDDATKVAERATSDSAGRYIFPGLRPAGYTITVEAQGFKKLVRPNVVLRVDQATVMDLTVEVGAVTTTVEVKGSAPLLNSASPALGQEIDNRYITELPLLGRDITNLAYLAPGITEVSPNGALFGSPATITGVNWVSNGQRLSTTEVRLDSALNTSPETGEGGMFTVKYKPLVESLQEFKVQNNSLSAEYGNNGGTVINMVTKSGTNQFHGTGYWFFQRTSLNANDFFANKYGNPKPNFLFDQYGGSIGGPIKKEKTFFFFDFEKIRSNSFSVDVETVPTLLQRQGDFSQTMTYDSAGNPVLEQIFNPYDVHPVTDAQGNVIDYQRSPFPNNVIPSSMMGPLAMKILSFYPEPTAEGDKVTHLYNFSKSGTARYPDYQFDIKIDHNFSEKSRLSSRFSRYHDSYTGLSIFGNAAESNASAGHGRDNAHSAVLDYTRTVSSTTVWDSRIALLRIFSPRSSPQFDVTSVGLPAILQQGGFNIFPRFDVSSYASLGTYGWTDTISAGTQFQLASTLTKIVGPHTLKFGGERRLIFTNFTQPGFPGGYFQFDQYSTMSSVYNPDSTQGNALAGLLLDFGTPYSWGGLNLQPGTATKSKETAFFGQDDWRVTNRLTLNLGLRYEWSNPYTERFNRAQIIDFDQDTGINIPGLGELRGVPNFTNPNHRSVSPDRNNFAPRAGFAYRLGDKTVFRGGAGIYYGVNWATNNWLSGSAFRSYSVWLPSLDSGITRFATLENPYPNGLNYPQGKKYGILNMWGIGVDQDMSLGIRNAEIYQWNIGIQRKLSDTLLLEVNYSANRSVHLPFRGTDNRNFLSREVAQKWGHAALSTLVSNPFQPLFSGPNAIFNEPPSIYNNDMIPQSLLLEPYPQFNGGLTGFPLFVANARYNALQVRFEKRYSHGLNFLGSYTLSKAVSDSDVGGNTWLGNYAGIQDLGNLKGEYSRGGSDTPHRLVFGWSYELPVGHGGLLGSSWGRPLNALLGGWQINGNLTLQSGFPLNVTVAYPTFDFGTQRPNTTGNPRSKFSAKDVVDGKGNFFNLSAFSDPGPEIPGNAPRFDPRLRVNSISNLNASIFKKFRFSESKELQYRVEFFNFTNTPRFGVPVAAVGDPAFGTISSDTNGGRQVQMGLRFIF